MRVREDAENKSNELAILRKHLGEATETLQLLQVKEKDYRQLQETIADYERELIRLKDSEKATALHCSEIVQLFHEISEPRTIPP